MSSLILLSDKLNLNNNTRLFAQTADSTPVTNTIAAGNLIGSGVGSLTFPADGFQVGDSFSITMWGHINSKNPVDLRIQILGNTSVLGETIISLPNITTKHWNLETRFTIRALGGPGVAQIVSAGQFTYSKNASNAFEGGDFSVVNNTTFDTRVDNLLRVTAKWNAADPQNSIYSECFVLNKIY